MKIVLFFSIYIFCIESISCSKILVLLPVGFKSHNHVFQPLIQALSSRGHDLTVVTSSPSTTPLPSNIREISPLSLDSVVKAFGNAFEIRKMGRFAFSATFDLNLILNLQNKTYADPTFREVIGQQYDLVILNGFLNEAFVGAVYKMGAPFILVTTMPAPGSITAYTGNHLPSSFVPVPFWDLTQHMTFTQRLTNYALNLLFDVTAKIFYFPKYEAIYREALGPDIPDLGQLFSNVSLLLMNSHFSLNYPRPNLPDNIEVGGMHCRPPKPLEKELDAFLSGSDHGFIYFSLGSIVKTNDMPEELRKVFVKVFSRLKQRVLWKWESENMEDLPPNVKLAKWIPQQDVLGHPKIRIFMTHGGLLSTQEAAYHGVPLLGIPVFADQDLNMMQSESQGFALTLELLNITETELEWKLKRLLEEPKFHERAKTLSKIVHDQTESALERAVYWSEYVIRHKGAHHLRSAARNLNYFQVHSYDVILFLLTILTLTLFLVKVTLQWIVRQIRRATKSSKVARDLRKKLN